MNMNMLKLDNLTGKYINHYIHGYLYVIRSHHDEDYIYVEALAVSDNIDDASDITRSSMSVRCNKCFKESIRFFQKRIDMWLIYEISRSEFLVKFKNILLKWYNEADRILDSVVDQGSISASYIDPVLSTLEQQDKQQDNVEQKDK